MQMKQTRSMRHDGRRGASISQQVPSYPQREQTAVFGTVAGGWEQRWHMAFGWKRLPKIVRK